VLATACRWALLGLFEPALLFRLPCLLLLLPNDGFSGILPAAAGFPTVRPSSCGLLLLGESGKPRITSPSEACSYKVAPCWPCLVSCRCACSSADARMVKGTKLVLAARELLTLPCCCPASAAAPAAVLAAAAPGTKLPLTRVRALRVLALAGL
jgi:hypothetical protein